MALDLIKFGTLVREIRTERNLKLADITEATGLSAITLAKVEKGNPARLNTIEKLSDIYKVDLFQYLNAFRTPDSFFSQEFYQSLKPLLIENNFRKIHELLVSNMNAIRESYLSTTIKKANLKYLCMLDKIINELLSLNLDNKLTNENIDLIIKCFASSKNDLWNNNAKYDFELYLMLYNAVTTSGNDNTDDAASQLRVVLQYINDIGELTTQQKELKVLTTLNLSNILLLEKQGNEVLILIDAIIDDASFTTTSSLHNALLLRKGVAMYLTNNSNFVHLIAIPLLNDSKNNSLSTYKYLKDQHNINIDEYIDMGSLFTTWNDEWDLL